MGVSLAIIIASILIIGGTIIRQTHEIQRLWEKYVKCKGDLDKSDNKCWRLKQEVIEVKHQLWENKHLPSLSDYNIIIDTLYIVINSIHRRLETATSAPEGVSNGETTTAPLYPIFNHESNWREYNRFRAQVENLHNGAFKNLKDLGVTTDKMLELLLSAITSTQEEERQKIITQLDELEEKKARLAAERAELVEAKEMWEIKKDDYNKKKIGEILTK